MLKVGLIGNPNSGKTTIFNHISGRAEKTGNWSGVTVKKSTYVASIDEREISFTDCPGIYSLTQAHDSTAEDARITFEQLLNQEFDLIVNVIDGSNLSRSLYLTSQLLEAGFKVIVVINMLDLADQKSINIDKNELICALGCHVIEMDFNKDVGVKKLFSILEQSDDISFGKNFVKYSKPITDVIDKLAKLKDISFYKGIRHCAQLIWLLEGCFANNIEQVEIYQKQLQNIFSEDLDIVIADERYSAIDHLVKKCQTRIKKSNVVLDFLDSITMHKYFGIPFFFLVMYAVLVVSINIGGLLQDFFDSIISIYYINNLHYLLDKLQAPDIIVSVLTIGFGQGINTVLSFVPIIGSIFFLLGFLEDSGYMTRATFVLSRLINSLGLPSKSFIPLIIGFGCNVPSIMATRNINNFSDKLITIMMSPFLSCSARLAVYTVFVSVFFKQGGHNVIFLLYLIGILCALLTGYLFRKYIVVGEQEQILYEMPTYRLPSLKSICKRSCNRISNFVYQTGKYILFICIILSILNDSSFGTIFGCSGDSVLVAVSKFITPLFIPIGVMESNWQITVSLFTGILAKEAILGTLNTLYSQAEPTVLEFVGLSGLYEIIQNFWSRIINLPYNMFTFNLQGESALSFPTKHALFDAFASYREVFAYLLFISLYLPCLSTAVVIRKELNTWWMIFSVLWSTILGYGLAVIFYQSITFSIHPMQSIYYIVWTCSVFVICWLSLKFINLDRNVLSSA